ncbi:hypothetical protein K450DRAFT_252230 [Umbelopsis ramanniana AG]|uniref:Glutathione S-transferase n=1 Tax=Umbelopsis ramanniana AG TaxID=1314678 RepID=A0AAD5HC10_UMBRA|nr:uncharacterized protein K450DRAFT_252230 [Umbelopsis ramanniana AG]KAI8577394.1 hypothetical protein K450DRAFT_252230 [Umbelopsis ramanniana AG]
MSSNYEIFYFELHGLALTTRALLSIGGFEWNNRFPKNWKEEEKATTPLGKLPVLTETRADGSKFVLAESNAINRYIARKAGLYGSSEDETALIDQFYESWTEIIAKGLPVMRLKGSEPEKYTEQLAIYHETVVGPILAKHEEALQKNGTGYYVGSKLSLVDVHATAIVTGLGSLVGDESSYPHLWKLAQNVRSLDAVKAEVERFPIRP